MTDKPSVAFHLRLVQERHVALKDRINDLFKALSSDVHDEKVRANEALLGACRALESTMSEADRPDWLTALTKSTNDYAHKHDEMGRNHILLHNLVHNRDSALNHAWSFDQESPETDYQFDAIYQQCKEDSQIPRLFDSLIETLEKMIDSGEIDSISALRRLEQLISIIRQNKRGSYFSTMVSWEFISSFLKNLAWQELRDLPGLKQLVSAFEKTAVDMDIELEQMHSAMTEEIKKKTQTTLPSLTYKRKSEHLLEHETGNE